MFNTAQQITSEAIDTAIKLQVEAKITLERVVSVLASGYVDSEVRTREIQNSFQAISNLTRATEILTVTQIQLQLPLADRLQSQKPLFGGMSNPCKGCNGAAYRS